MSPDVHSRWFQEELVVLDVGRGEYYALDELGGRIYEELARGRSLDEAVDTIADDYDVAPARLRSDARTLVEELLTRGLIMER